MSSANVTVVEERLPGHALQQLVLQHHYVLSGVAAGSLIVGVPLWINTKSSISRHQRLT